MALRRVGLARVLDQYPHTLSGGMKQRAAIARALATEPDVLLMDEPFAALDALTRLQMQRDLLEIAEETGLTLLFVTHAIDEAVLLGTRLHLLSAHPGRTIASFDTSEFGAADIGTGRFERMVQEVHARLFGTGDAAMSEVLSHTRSEAAPAPAPVIVARPHPLARLARSLAFRRFIVLAVLALAWEIAARWQDNPIMLPSFTEAARAFIEASLNEGLLLSAAGSLLVLLKGYVLALAHRHGHRLARGLERLPARRLADGGGDARTRCPPSRCCRLPCCGSGSARRACCSCWSMR